MCQAIFSRIQIDRTYNYRKMTFKQSKKISNDQEPIQSDPTPALKTKRETTKYIY